MLLVPQLRKGINNDTKDNVQCSDIDHHEERGLKQTLGVEFGVRSNYLHRICDSASVPEAPIHHKEKAGIKVSTNIKVLTVIIVVEAVVVELRNQQRVGVDNKHSQHQSQGQLVKVEECSLQYKLSGPRNIHHQ